MVAVAPARQRKRKTVLGPKDDGRRMSLDEFTVTPAQEGCRVELHQGVIEVSTVPAILHGLIIDLLRELFYLYRAEHRERISYIAAGPDSKVLSEPDQSERHPDLSVYLTPPPPGVKQPWSEWTPEIVIEVVSESSVKHDYEEKPPEYRTVSVREYWIVDPLRKVIVIHTRWRGVWKAKTLKPGKSYETRLLPGLKLDVRKILAAGK